MLSGVKIVSRYNESYNNDSRFAISITVFAILIVVSLIVGMFSISFSEIRLLAVIFIAITIMAGFFQNFVYKNTVEYFNIYTVTIDDSVGFNDFYSKYKILEEIGNGVYKIRDRELQK